jgi:WD40-like Beta Propeller Repeat
MSAAAPSRRRLAAFAAVVAACAVVAAVAIAAGARAGDGTTRASAGAGDALPAAKAAGRPVVVYRVGDAERRGADGQVAIASLASANGRPTLTGLRCARLYVSPAGSGICVARGSGFAAGYVAKVFGADLRVRHTIALEGIASRARVSPDGRYGSVTMFVTGDSYADAGAFSTRTTIVDLASGRTVADLEDFAVTDGERQVTAVDVNFWGVTFARDSDRFFATLATGGRTYLIEGSVSARRAQVIHDNVECPSLSPDGTRIAFKKRTGSAAVPWRLTVLDLRTMRETPLAEARSVDDQAEWLDDGHVLYGLDGAVWSVRADGTGRPAPFLARAASPAVVRW